VVVIADKRLKSGGNIDDPRLPFAIRVDAWYPNSSRTKGRSPNAPAPPKVKAFTLPSPAGNHSTASTKARRRLAQRLCHRDRPRWHQPGHLSRLRTPRPSAGSRSHGKKYQIELRFKRLYKPYTIHLIKFSFDRYTGTKTPRNYSSRVRFVDPTNNFDREILIWMNHPLRYRGETFYQAGFQPNEKTTILQVVKIPAGSCPTLPASSARWG